MFPVSREFTEAVRATKRRVVGKVTIDYTDPLLDSSINVTANEQARISWPAQTADSVMMPAYKWASLDGTWVLDGTWRLAPDTEVDARAFQMGWWGAQLAGADGSFAPPYPTLTVTFTPRPMRALQVVGDEVRGEWPVDFVIRLYDPADTLLHEESVTGNTEVRWSKPLDPQVNQVAKLVLEIRKWSHSGRQCKVLEFYSSIQETYEADQVLSIKLLEEREVESASLPVGNISANELVVTLDNSDRRFDADNVQSPLYQALRPNRRVRAWLGVVKADQTTEWVPLGTYWSIEWRAPDDTVEATVLARDRMELLSKTTYRSSQVQTNVSLYQLAEQVLQDAGLGPSEYAIDPSLQDIIVPYAWFDPVSHREALRLIAAAALAAVYADRDGVIRIVPWDVTSGEQPITAFLQPEYPAETTYLPTYVITEDDYFRADNPARPDQVANIIEVDTQPLRPVDTPQEVYRSNNPIMVPAGKSVTVTAHYNSTPVIDAVASLDNPPADVSITGVTYYGWGAEVTITNSGSTDAGVTLVINGRPLQVLNKERAEARDEASIIENGALRYHYPDNPLVQTLDVAQKIADTLLASFKNARRDLEMEWRGDPALTLGDRITVKGHDYHIIRHELEWTGALSARLVARRVS